MQLNFRRFTFFLLLSSVWQMGFGGSLLPLNTQAVSCGQVITNLNQAIGQCSEINNNWVCYGSVAAQAAPVKYRFFEIRDRRPFSVLEDVKTTDQAGVVLMNLLLEGKQAPMKIVLFGSTELQSDSHAANMMTLSVGNNDYLCDATPPGMVVQTEEGVKNVITVNGVDIELKSTAYISLQQDGRMIIVNIEGHVKVTINGIAQELLVGQQTLIAFTNGQPAFVGSSTASPLFASPVAQWLARNGLPRIHNTNTTAAKCVDEINFGQTITAQNIDPGQECLYHFCANAGDTVTVQMDALDPALNPWLDLRGPGGWLVAFNDDTKSTDLNSLVCNRALPLTSCDYTIVARSTRNASKGPFKLTLSKQTACVQPLPRCNVVAPRGVGLRRGPGENEPVLQNLPTDAKLQPLERTSDGAWAYVQVVNTQQKGWVNQTANTIECEDDGGLGPVISIKAPTPTSAPEPTRKPPKPTATPTPSKSSPFPTP